jgi:hypothetical protein
MVSSFEQNVQINLVINSTLNSAEGVKRSFVGVNEGYGKGISRLQIECSRVDVLHGFPNKSWKPKWFSKGADIQDVDGKVT